MFKVKPDIPTEVVEAIIDHLHDDKMSLSACSLVAQAWLPTSRLHLIPSIKVHLKNYEQLLRLLAIPESRLALSVREVMFARLTEKDNSWMNNAIPTLAKCFPSITSLSLIGIRWQQLNAQSETHLHESFPKIEKALFLDCNFTSFYRLLKFLCSFQVAEHLNIVMCTWESTGDSPPPNFFKISSSLRELLTDGNHEALMSWMADQNPLRLEHFLVDQIGFSDLENVKSILHRAGSTLRHFQLRFSDTYNEPTEPGPGLDLSKNTSLEKLKLTIGNPYTMLVGFSLPLNSSFILPLLRSISSSHLHELTFRIIVCIPEDLLAIDWYEIDCLSKEMAWGGSLKSFLIELTGKTSNFIPENFMEDFMKEAKSIIYTGLHEIDERGLLDVRFKLLTHPPDTWTSVTLRDAAFKGLPLPRQ